MTAKRQLKSLSVVCCVAACCSVLQRVVACCSVIDVCGVMIDYDCEKATKDIQVCIAVCCNVLHELLCVAACCSVVAV